MKNGDGYVVRVPLEKKKGTTNKSAKPKLKRDIFDDVELNSDIEVMVVKPAAKQLACWVESGGGGWWWW